MSESGGTMSDLGVTVSVLTPVLNEESALAESLEALQGQELDGRIEFLMIDGGSEDRSKEILRRAAAEDPRIRILDNPERRTPQALNIGLAAASGRYVARMDAHTRYPPNYLALGIDRLEKGDVDLVAGPAIAVGQGRWSSQVALALRSALGTGGASFRHRSSDEFETYTAFTGVWRRETLIHHGGWDEGWPLNQDAELAARMLESGERIICLPAMAAEYVPRDSITGLARQYFRYGEYRCKTSGRHPGSLRTANLLPPSVAAMSLVAVCAPRMLRRMARMGIASYLAVIGVESVRMAIISRCPRSAWRLPIVFVTMHHAHGWGFIFGAVKFGPPLKALGMALSKLTASLRRVLGRFG